jgi:hypothetical protein
MEINMKEYDLSYSKQPSFIGSWIIDEKICDGLIDFYKNDKKFKITRGCVGSVGNLNLESKDSYDMIIPPNYEDRRVLIYCTELQKCIESYCKKFKYSHEVTNSWTATEDMILQYYETGGGFKVFHCENDGFHVYRHLVFMTYLNDVPGGGTEFYYQNLTTPAIKGLTLIWPAAWTHTHKGQISKHNEKYIITGWLSFIK